MASSAGEELNVKPESELSSTAMYQEILSQEEYGIFGREELNVKPVSKSSSTAMSQEILLQEKCGAFGREKLYVKPENQDSIVCVESSVSRKHTFLVRLLEILRQVFLPQGYPDSVSSDYLEYQLWDTIQAFCSTITGAFAARAVMSGIGVGSADATPLAAAITWIFKDGTGMVGSICFAWWKGTSLDADCKKWRLVADFLNDVALCIELLLPLFRDWSTLILCASTSMKAVVGVAGGATRAAITQHQAIRDNMADVSAKDGSQERFVNLTASFVAVFLLTTIPEGWCVWVVFALLTIVHLVANYGAVRCLVMTTLNHSRYVLILSSLEGTPPHCSVRSTKDINMWERVIGPNRTEKDIFGCKIVLGASLSSLVGKKVLTYEKIKMLQNIFKAKRYMLIPDLDSRTVSVIFKPREKSLDVIEAFFHAVLLCSMGNYNYDITPSPTNSRKEKRPLGYFSTPPDPDTYEFTEGAFKKLNEEHKKVFHNFKSALIAAGWTTQHHHMDIGEWRAQWSSNKLAEFHCL